MRVRLERYETANRSVQTKSLLAFVLGGIGLAFFGFVTFLGLLMIAMPDKEAGENRLWAARAGIVVGLFFGLVPTVISALFVAWGVRLRARFRRLGELAAIARQTPALTTAQIAHALRLSPAEADGLVIEASRLGLVEEGPSPSATTAPPYAPAPAGAEGPPPLATAATIAASPNARSPSGRPPPVAGGPAAGGPHGAPVVPPIVEPGLVLGAYRVEEPLGRGGMGAVHAARHLRTGRRYAVKTILPGAATNEAAIRRFEREATAASALGHPGIVQVHDFDQGPGGLFYLVMDLLEGETLQERIDRGGALPWSDAQRLALELCDALAAAHDQGLLHRDVKPSNVFLARAPRSSQAKERAVLVDFGLVKPIFESGSVLTSAGAVVGTPMYMSPEQARGEPLDIRSDVYSLAAVIFEMTTGAPPFADRSLASVYARLLNEPPPLASQVSKPSAAPPKALDPVLARALAKDRAARYPSARDLGAALAAVDEARAPTTERL